LAVGKAPRLPQDEEKATYAPAVSREEELIVWSKPAADIHNLVRSLDPTPGAYTGFRGRRLKVWRTSLSNGTREGPGGECTPFSPGTVCSTGKNYIEVTAGRGAIKILELQLEGKKRIGTEDFLKGYDLKVGERFA